MTTKVLALARAAWGTFLVVEPDRAMRVAGLTGPPSARVVTRVIGARHVLQALATLALRNSGRTRRFAAVDVAHGLSMAALAAAAPAGSPRRRAAGAAAGEASVWTLASVVG